MKRHKKSPVLAHGAGLVSFCKLKYSVKHTSIPLHNIRVMVLLPIQDHHQVIISQHSVGFSNNCIAS